MTHASEDDDGDKADKGTTTPSSRNSSPRQPGPRRVWILVFVIATGCRLFGGAAPRDRGEPSCSSACYTHTSTEGPECWCTAPRPCQTSIAAGACP